MISPVIKQGFRNILPAQAAGTAYPGLFCNYSHQVFDVRLWLTADTLIGQKRRPLLAYQLTQPNFIFWMLTAEVL